MKTLLTQFDRFVAIALIGAGLSLPCERSLAASVKNDGAPDEVGANFRAWKVQHQGNAKSAGGESTSSRVVEIGTGMNYWDGKQYVPSDPRFELTRDSFAADRVQHKVKIAANINQIGAVQLTTPDGKRLNSTPVAIGLYDAQSGDSLVIATITNAAGVLVNENQVAFQNAFSGVDADIVYTLDQSSFEQDVVFTGRINPANYGFKPETTLIQIYTEFYDAPQPDRQRKPIHVENDPNVRKRMASPDLMDETLGFGDLVIGDGQAFTANGASAAVAKEMVVIDDQTFLVESVPYRKISDGLEALPVKKGHASKGVNSKSGLAQVLRADAAKPKTPMTPQKAGKEMAYLVDRTRGVTIDYRTHIGGGFSSTVVFQGDTTYFVVDNVICNGPVIIEGGTVIKYKVGKTIALSGTSTLTCTTLDYRPAVFTGMDDDTIGESAAGYPYANTGYTGTINPSGYANPALVLYNSATLSNLKFRYAQKAVSFNAATYPIPGFTVKHSQFVDCIKGLHIGNFAGSGGSLSTTVQNCLFTHSQYPTHYPFADDVYIAFSGVFQCYECTFHDAPALLKHDGSGAMGMQFYGSIFSTIPTKQTVAGNVSWYGSYNGFYNCFAAFGNNVVPIPSNPFQSAGAGNFYLDQNSVCIDAAPPTLSPVAFANDIKKRTTKVPDTSKSFGTVSSPDHWPIAAQRDSNRADLGYHYPALDYLAYNVTVSPSVALTLDEGVAVGCVGPFTGFGQFAAITFGSGSQLITRGNAVTHNQICVYNAVQEQPGNLNNVTPASTVLLDLTGPPVTLDARFTDFEGLSGLGNIMVSWSGEQARVRDCRIGPGNVWVESPSTFVALSNNVIERTILGFGNSSFNTPIYFFNNLGWNSSVTFNNTSGGTIIRDNLFSNCVVHATSSTLTHDHNAYFGGSTDLTGDTTLTALTFVSGALGEYYWNSSTPTLINVGSVLASVSGLYHYTTRNIANSKETTTQVDIGFHYVGTDSSSNPIDTDGDGIPDYIEDANGNGVNDPGESSWKPTITISASSPDAWESGEDPGVFTITRTHDTGALTVSVSASGTATPGSDYPAINSTVTIPAGADSTTVYVWPIADGTTEPDETVILTANASTKYNVNAPGNATVSIHDGSPTLTDPKTPGSFTYSSVIYASTGPQYITDYQSPSPNYAISRRLNISPFFNSIDPTWGFDATSVPINGRLSVPNGTGPFPVAIFVHGNHSAFAFSDPGYVYLCQLLASRGILAVTVDENFLNQNFGENGARGIVLLEHVRQFGIWNTTAGHPLFGKVDMNHIMLVGHSRGGEAVGHASYFNTYTGNDPVVLDGSAGLGPYALNLKALLAIAPTDQQYIPTGGPFGIRDNYLIIHGSRDGDVSDFEGYLTYDRAHPIPITATGPLPDANGFKSVGWIIGANHNYFNTTWSIDGSPILARSEQEDVARVYVSTMAEVKLLEHQQYLKFLKNANVGSSWLPHPAGANYASQFQALSRLFIDHYEEDALPATCSPPVAGANTWNAGNFSEMFFQSFSPTWIFEETHGVRFEWSAPGAYYQASFSGAGLDASNFGQVALRIGQSNEGPNPVGANQNLRIIVQDTTAHSAAFVVSSVCQLLYPDTGAPKTVMQTVRIPLNAVRNAGVDVSHLAFVQLVFDQTSSGVLYFDEIQLSN